MSAHHGRKLGFPDLLSFDMGGTTAKGALVRNFTALKQYELEVGRVHEFKSGSGLPAKLPVIDMIEIASGGGSLAQVDERGLIRVGPKSADPGPACYAKGGTRPTLTDADMVLGYLDPEFFLGGEMRPDADTASAAIEAHVARPAGLDPIRAPWGVHEIANEDVARAFRIHASERGFDYRRSSMVACRHLRDRARLGRRRLDRGGHWHRCRPARGMGGPEWHRLRGRGRGHGAQASAVIATRVLVPAHREGARMRMVHSASSRTVVSGRILFTALD